MQETACITCIAQTAPHLVALGCLKFLVLCVPHQSPRLLRRCCYSCCSCCCHSWSCCCLHFPMVTVVPSAHPGVSSVGRTGLRNHPRWLRLDRLHLLLESIVVVFRHDPLRLPPWVLFLWLCFFFPLLPLLFLPSFRLALALVFGLVLLLLLFLLFVLFVPLHDTKNA